MHIHSNRVQTTMVSTRSMNTRSTRSRTYAIITPVIVIAKTNKVKKVSKTNAVCKKVEHVAVCKKIEPVAVCKKIEQPVRRSTRVSKPVQDTFNFELYGRDSNGKRNKYHGWTGDRWQRDFNGWDRPCWEERANQSMEDRRIRREQEQHGNNIEKSGYVLDDFIAHEEHEWDDEEEEEMDWDSDDDSDDEDEDDSDGEDDDDDY